MRCLRKVCFIVRVESHLLPYHSTLYRRRTALIFCIFLHICCASMPAASLALRFARPRTFIWLGPEVLTACSCCIRRKEAPSAAVSRPPVSSTQHFFSENRAPLPCRSFLHLSFVLEGKLLVFSQPRKSLVFLLCDAPSSLETRETS